MKWKWGRKRWQLKQGRWGDLSAGWGRVRAEEEGWLGAVASASEGAGSRLGQLLELVKGQQGWGAVEEGGDFGLEG